MRLHTCALFFCGVVSALFPCAHLATAQSAKAGTAPAPAYAADPRYQAAVHDAALLFKRHQFAFAADGYKKANKIAGGQCMECMTAEYTAYVQCGDDKNAIQTAQAMEALATTPDGKSAAQFRRGSAMYKSLGSKPKPEKLEAVHEVLQQALQSYPRNASALYLDARFWLTWERSRKPGPSSSNASAA